ncbi:MAG TPA: HAMP domain-containing methyl-accepting chemotaxis protein [Candidatus Dormibacteraeota bacterium]|nr:HAMP domain-containing methyl-accepting chemotaxis protein [Candidatus Dormibacteraeota bacterium]
MELRRAPPRLPVAKGQAPIVRVLKPAPAGPSGAPRGSRQPAWMGSYFLRVLAGALIVTIPISVILAFLVSNWSAQTSTDQAKARSEVAAENAAVRITDWVSERKAELRGLALGEAGHVGSPSEAAAMLGTAVAHPDFVTLEVVNPTGGVVATTRPDSGLQLGTGSTTTQRLQVETVQPIQKDPSGVTWVITAPIIGPSEKSQGFVVGDLYISVLGRLLIPAGMKDVLGKTEEIHVANAQRFILYSSDWGILPDNNSIIAKGGLSLQANGTIVGLANANGAGALQATDYRQHEVLAGYQLVPSLAWVVIASTDTATALAPVYLQELKTSLVQAGGTLLLIAFALILARLTTRPIMALSRAAESVERGDLSVRVHLTSGGEVRRLGATFNAMLERLSGVLFRLKGEVGESAGSLSAAAEQLASATFEQTTAATQTSSSMEELARSTVSIADTVDRVAAQAGEVRANLELAQSDLRASGDRTLALAGRVNEIEGILELINDIADQTNLLALNAAIEAARAGDAGRGFAVVADEVRRLAERSKVAAAQIAKLVEGAQAQSSETVMALEKGVKQMERGLVMMQAMTELSGQVQLATQQQRASTEEVVAAIEHIAEGSRAVATTAQDIAAAAARQGKLANDLAGSGWEVGGSD